MAVRRDAAVGKLVVALDTSARERAHELARALAGRVGMMKVGLEAFTSTGPALIGEIRALGMPVFLDLKLHDIPNTVERAAANCAQLGVSLVTVHAGGGEAMMRAAVAGVAAGTPSGATRPRVLAVTVLTSLDDAALDQLHMPGGAATRVRSWAKLAQASGCDGIVCSPHELALTRQACGREFILLAPGIRPAGAGAADQKRVATPAAAIRDGADFLVVGRPITEALDPAAAAEAILQEIVRSDW